MLIIPSIPFRRRRLVRAPQSPPPPPIHPGLLITQVSPDEDPTRLVVQIEGEATWDGESVPTAFAAMTSNGVMEACTAMWVFENTWFTLVFPAEVALGAAWEINGPMDGITPAIAWPQAGIVTE